MKKFFYRVTDGQSIHDICNKFNLPQTYLVKLNCLNRELLDGDLLYIEIPDKFVYTVQPTDTLDGIAKKFSVDEEAILKNNDIPYIFYGLKIMV